MRRVMDEVNGAERETFFALNEPRLLQMVVRAREKGEQTGESQCVVCIDVDDPTWTELVDKLMPGADWDQFRRAGQKPVARGVVPAEPIAELVRETCGLEPVTDKIKVYVFASTGVSVWER